MAKDDDPAHLSDIPRTQPDPRPDFTAKPLKPTKLPSALQETLDNEQTYWETITSGHGQDSTNTDYRYAAYASRVRTILLSAHRYVAYTSDIGESFRPIAHPWLVKGAYGVSWAYLIGDVSHEGYKAYLRNQQLLNAQLDKEETKVPGAEAAKDDLKAVGASSPEPGIAVTAIAAAKDLGKREPQPVPLIDDYRTVMVQRAIFQGVASMGLPAFTIHSIVKYGGKALKDVKNQRLRTWGPIGLGLAAVPALPYMFDEPVEYAMEYVFHKAFAAAGKDAPSLKEKEL